MQVLHPRRFAPTGAPPLAARVPHGHSPPRAPVFLIYRYARFQRIKPVAQKNQKWSGRPHTLPVTTTNQKLHFTFTALANKAKTQSVHRCPAVRRTVAARTRLLYDTREREPCSVCTDGDVRSVDVLKSHPSHIPRTRFLCSASPVATFARCTCAGAVPAVRTSARPILMVV